MAIASQLAIFAVGSTSALALWRLFDRESPPGIVAVLSAFQNNAYLPIPIVMALMPAELRGRGEFVIGCFVVCFTPLLWSVGIIMLGAGRQATGVLNSLGNALNPPFIAAVSGLLAKILFLELGWTMPKIVMDVLKLTGAATTPLAMIVLGALLAETHWSKRPRIRTLAIVTVVKLLLLPGLAVLALRSFGWLPYEFAFVALLEASMPPATNISVAAKRFGLRTDIIAVAILVTYLISALTVPMWLTLLPQAP